MRVRLVEPGRRSGRRPSRTGLSRKQGKYSLIRIKIDTGRRAQIRLHMANLERGGRGHQAWVGEGQRQQLCLHASSLSFDHPNGKRMTITTISHGPSGRTQSVNAPLEYLRIDDKLNGEIELDDMEEIEQPFSDWKGGSPRTGRRNTQSD